MERTSKSVGQCPTTQHCPLFYVEAKECSLIRNECRARILRTQHWQMYCIMYEVLRTRIYMFRIQHSRISTGGVVACAPCPGDIKPKCQEFQEFQEFQAPSRCILSLVVELHKTMPIYTSFFQRLCGMYGVPLSGQLPVLEYPKPWFLERVFSAIVWAVFVSPKKGPCSSAAFTL